MPEEMTAVRACYLALVLASFFIPFATQIILVRFLGLYRENTIRQRGPAAAALVGLLPVGGLFLVWLLAFSIRSLGGIFRAGFYLFAVYLLMAYVYFHVFNMSETARRIRILAHGHREGKVVKEELTQNYTRKEMVEIRIARLLALGEITRRGDRYASRGNLLLLPARAVFGFRRLLFPAQQ